MNRRVREPRTLRAWGKGLTLVPSLIVAALLAGVFSPLSPAAAPPTPQHRVRPPEEPPRPEGVAKFTFEGRAQVGAATLFLNGHAPAFGAPALGTALRQVATLRVGELFHCWTVLDTDQFRPFPEALLTDIKDGTGIVVGTLDAGAYEKVLVLANLTSLKAFKGATDTTLSYANLFNEPAAHRGKVARAYGRLRRINRFDPPKNTLSEGVHDLYEAWIINDDYGANPYCVVFTNWPVGLPRDVLGQSTIKQKIFVEFDGYFFKKFRYAAADSKEKTRREAPLLIGNSLVVTSVRPPAPAPATTWMHQLLYVFMGILAGVVLIIAAMTYWFRRSDRGVRQRLLATRAGELVLPPPDAVPVAPPVDPTMQRFAGGNRPDKSRPATAETSAATRWGDRTGERGASPATGDSKPGEGGQASKGGLGLTPEPGEDAAAKGPQPPGKTGQPGPASIPVSMLTDPPFVRVNEHVYNSGQRPAQDRRGAAGP